MLNPNHRPLTLTRCLKTTKPSAKNGVTFAAPSTNHTITITDPDPRGLYIWNARPAICDPLRIRTILMGRTLCFYLFEPML